MTPAEFAAELRGHTISVRRTAGQVVKKGAQNVKVDARRTVSTSHSNSGKAKAGYHINYDMRGATEAEIGYDKPAGALGNFNEYGSVNNTPDNALGGALEREAPNLAKWLGEAVTRSW